MADSQEYHAAHLAFSRATIVEKAARGERIYDRLLTYTEDVVKAEADKHAGAVEALQAIYDRHHLNGDGSAGKVSGDALRALGIDPDAGEE